MNEIESSIAENVAEAVIQCFEEEVQRKAPAAAMLIPCPRCGRYSMKQKLHSNAVSRRQPVMICDECGIEEAFEDATGVKLPVREWAMVMAFVKDCNLEVTKDETEQNGETQDCGSSCGGHRSPCRITVGGGRSGYDAATVV